MDSSGLYYRQKPVKNTCSIILLLLVFNFQLSAQNQLQHYERKVSFSRITLPGDQFHSKNFLIVYADSIYNSATIHVKKASFPTVKNIDVQLKTVNKTYSFVQLSTKSKKNML